MKRNGIKRIVAYVGACLAVLVGFHLYAWRNGGPDGWVDVPLSGAQIILVVVGLIGIGVFIGRRWPT
jgi:hypothetical protein